MPYILKDLNGSIKAVSVDPIAGWEFVEATSRDYMDFLENALAMHDPFRESDIHLARVLEDLIGLLIEREIIRFTDFPVAAQKRLLERQSMRKQAGGLNLIDDSQDSVI